MAMTRSEVIFRRLDTLELSACMFFNRISHWIIIKRFFALISRLGDGVFWYSLMLMMAVLDYPAGSMAAVHMGMAALAGFIMYKIMKRHMVRQRPSMTWAQIHRGTPPLDLYSFPSGHTLHAVSFTIIAVAYYPGMMTVLLPLTILIALSRVVLGLHYPTDVFAGALIGAGLGFGSLRLLG
jgi:undecaprenyl-diphosphatase